MHSNIRLFSTSSDQNKSEPSKGKSISSDLGIIYPPQKNSNTNLNFKLCWRKILPLTPRNYFLLAPTRIFLGIGDSRGFFWGIPLFFSLLGFTMIILSWGTTYNVCKNTQNRPIHPKLSKCPKSCILLPTLTLHVHIPLHVSKYDALLLSMHITCLVILYRCLL